MAGRVGQPPEGARQLGNYRLISLQGKGGFAEVYLGEHIYLKTPAAIKLLQAKVTNEEDLQAFLKEAQTIAQLVHPHIVRVLDFGVDGETPYLVMDYATGGTLRQRHPRGTQLPLPTIVSYIKHIAQALQYAHEEKFIHRDIKPENMLVGRREAVLLSDFGIALMAQSSRYQSTQEVIGTVAYMAPEQIEGKPRPASDQYSLGVVVYEWITGNRPFHGSFTELCTQHMFAAPLPLREKLPTISPIVEQVVMTTLSKDPKGRFASVQAFAIALEQASRVDQPFHSSTPSQIPAAPVQPLQTLTMTSPAMPLSQQTVTSSPFEGLETPPTLQDQSRHSVGRSGLQNRPEPVQQGISRRTMLLGLGVVGLVGVSSGLTWLLSSQSPQLTPTAWYDGNYLYKKSITVDHTRVSGGSDLSNFPVLIELADPHLKTAGNGGYVQNSNGYDILFTDHTEIIRLDHEIEQYVPATGEIKMWVKIPTLEASTNTVIYIYFGNSTISSTQENKTGVWDDQYRGVWHLDETSGPQYDSTRNGNDALQVNVTTEGSVAGQIGGADAFNGSSNSLQINGLLDRPASITLSSWVLMTSGTSNGEVISLGDYAAIRMVDPNTYSGFYYNGSEWQGISASITNQTTGWHYVVYTVDGGTYVQTLYVDGAQKSQTTTTQAITYSGLGTNTFIGAHGSGKGYYFNGSLDEVRMSASVRSAGWIATEYNNQTSPSTFYTVSSLISK